MGPAATRRPSLCPAPPPLTVAAPGLPSGPPAAAPPLPCCAVNHLLGEHDWEGLRGMVSPKLLRALRDTCDEYGSAGLGA